MGIFFKDEHDIRKAFEKGREYELARFSLMLAFKYKLPVRLFLSGQDGEIISFTPDRANFSFKIRTGNSEQEYNFWTAFYNVEQGEPQQCIIESIGGVQIPYGGHNASNQEQYFSFILDLLSLKK